MQVVSPETVQPGGKARSSCIASPRPRCWHGGHVAAREARHSKLTACLGACRMQVQPSQPLTQRPRRDAIPRCRQWIEAMLVSAARSARSLSHSYARTDPGVPPARQAHRARVDQRLGAPGAPPYQCTVCSQAAAAWPVRTTPPDGTNGPAASAGAGVCPISNRSSRRAIARGARADIGTRRCHWHCTARPALGARVAGRCAWWSLSAARPVRARSTQLPRHRSREPAQVA